MGSDPRGPATEANPASDGPTPDTDVSPQAVLVSGASSGIGRAIVDTLAEHGFQVLAGVRDDAARKELEEGAGERVIPVRLDITDARSIGEAEEMAKRHQLVGLVNNAGAALLGPLEFLDPDLVREQFEVNLFGHLAVTQSVLPMLRKTRGRIINISSTSGRVAFPQSGAYAASKFALEGLSDALRRELAPWGVTVSLIEPGNIDTGIWKKSFEARSEAARRFPPEARDYYPEPQQARDSSSLPGPDSVARVVLKAMTTPRPKARYLVGRDARFYAVVRRLLPDSLLDRVVTP